MHLTPKTRGQKLWILIVLRLVEAAGVTGSDWVGGGGYVTTISDRFILGLRRCKTARPRQKLNRSKTELKHVELKWSVDRSGTLSHSANEVAQRMRSAELTKVLPGNQMPA